MFIWCKHMFASKRLNKFRPLDLWQAYNRCLKFMRVSDDWKDLNLAFEELNEGSKLVWWLELSPHSKKVPLRILTGVFLCGNCMSLCVGFLGTPWLPPTVQKHACEVDWWFEMIHISECAWLFAPVWSWDGLVTWVYPTSRPVTAETDCRSSCSHSEHDEGWKAVHSLNNWHLKYAKHPALMAMTSLVAIHTIWQ